MEQNQIDNLMLYVESTYEALGRELPMKAGRIDVLRAKAYLMQLSYQGLIPAYDQWHKQMFGVYPDGTDGWDWPAQNVMPWPPRWAGNDIVGQFYGDQGN